jgi:methylaspartate ammonia-lyase
MNRFIKALQTKYQAKIDEAVATIELYLNAPVGVGEHPDILDVLDTYVQMLDDNTGKLQVLNTFMQPPEVKSNDKQSSS